MPYAALRQKLRVSLECQVEEEKERWRRAALICWHILCSQPRSKGDRKPPSWPRFQKQLGLLEDKGPKVANFDHKSEVAKAYRVLEMVEGRSFG